MQESTVLPVTEKNAGARISLAKPLAPEDVRPGDFVAVLHQTVELPSFLWHADSFHLPPAEPVRIQLLPDDAGTPLKVVSVCLPFVFAKPPTGNPRSLDLRKCHLARLDRRFAKTVWKSRKKQTGTNLLRELLS